ncbi:putative baseplate assembly protein [Dyella flagellata]|uniref:Baseplate assembly protein n=1 Tax=Dyella flagellata TaxID=1867833 RepID=A0ABQ5XE07_9GAMM|nr:putative baseplate assembly protein [Dyella flagellata]GLQ89920.1 putative baseplate assembly protein [Dyella flagellata]
MPLDNLLPIIDDRSYDDIVSEIRNRIARYAPEWQPGDSAWTDVNDNDPGVTFAQVFAWLADMLLYRMNLVPQLNYIKFLQLLGIELQPASPASAEVTLPVLASCTQSVVTVPARVQLSADPGDGGPPLIFETVGSLKAFRAKLDQLLSAEGGGGYSDITSANDGVTGFQPFGAQAAKDAEFALGFVDSAALPSELLDLSISVQSDPQASGWYGCGDNITLPANLAWEYWNGTYWLPLNVLKDDSLAFTRSGHVTLKLPAGGITATAKLSGSSTDSTLRYWIRARVVSSQYLNPPSLLAIRTNSVAVQQAETISNEVLGGSDGSRNQTFQLGATPVVAGSLQLQIQQSSDGFDTWTEVTDFFGAGPNDMVYVLDRTAGTILCGDGINGAIPVAFIGNPGGNVVARVYQVGGGKRGNVAAGLIDTLTSPIDGIDSNGVGNLFAAYGGRDEETLDQAKKRAPLSLRSQDRAVSNSDFEYLATQAGNVARAKALPFFHPQFPGLQVPGTISVVIVPDTDDPAPQASDGLLRTVCSYLDARRLLATELFVLRPLYQLVQITGDVVAADDADLVALGVAIEQSLLDYFHPLIGGDQGDGWPFGGTIYYSRIYQRLLAIDGVTSITDLTIVLDGDAQAPCTDIPIQPHALLYSVQHAVLANYASEVTA